MNVASTAAFQSGPTMAVYYATKAYVLSFSEAIANEVSDKGVTITTLCPGATESGFQAAAAMEESALVKELVDTGLPVFGICLGHQLLAQSQGISTYKMHAGHRGINHPVKNIISGKSEITSQNHGFTVNEKEINKNPNIEITHVNLNDNTIEGIRLKGKKVFSVQYHPESNPGPYDSRYLFDEFVANMQG